MQTSKRIMVFILTLVVIEGIVGRSIKRSVCPPGVPTVNCLVDPCLLPKCPGDPTAICNSNYCGGCNAVWLTTCGKPAKCEVKSKCPPGVKEVQCLKNPCQDATCPADPTAKCVANYCGGCNAVWLTPKNTAAQCEEKSGCPPGVEEVQCFVNPCNVSECPGDPTAHCSPNYCVVCNAIWLTPTNQPADCIARS